MYDTTLGWRFVNPRMEEMGYTDSLGMTAENLAQERFLLTPDDEDDPDEMAAAYDVSREAQDSLDAVSARAWLQAMLEAEVTLAVAEARACVIPPDAAEALTGGAAAAVREATKGGTLASDGPADGSPAEAHLKPPKEGFRPDVEGLLRAVAVLP